MNKIKIVITGPAGSGKTTILHDLADFLNDSGWDVTAIDVASKPIDLIADTASPRRLYPIELKVKG